MRLVMMGTGGFAVPTFHRLLSSPHDVIALVTRPLKRGRGKRPADNPMVTAGERSQLPILTPNSINDAAAVRKVKELDADLLVVCDYGQILSSEALRAGRLGGINLHASLLPAYRGAAPINWAIYDGVAETGISVIHMTAKLDAGPIIVQRAAKILDGETSPELERRLAEIGADAVIDSIGMLQRWDGKSPIGKIQSHEKASRAPRLKKEDGLVDWARSARQIANQVRAFKPWPGTYTFFTRQGSSATRLILDQVAVIDDHDAGVEQGTILDDDSGHFLVSTSSGTLRLDVVQPEGKKKLKGAEFLRGYRLAAGDRMGEHGRT